MNHGNRGKQNRFGVLIFLIICTVALYKYYTRPVNLHNLIYNGRVRSIDVCVVTNGSDDIYEIEFIKEEDINHFINILNKYKYSKIHKMYIDGVYPASSNDLIDTRIFFSEAKVPHYNISIDDKNEVSISFGNGKYRDYIVKGNNGLYEELLKWVSSNFLY
ncbi:hypothetical protein E9840_03330 [Tissierella creatinini]|nr:hypothetical protein E9840_03330 [Tissierella creatinini]TJX60690.1 hypothetical protein E8P77_19725 [Soehngenia saccharolytica]